MLIMYICERCGKISTTKYGCGRFCSRSCANSHIQTWEINQKRRNTLKSKKPRKLITLTCSVCGKQFSPKFGKNGFQNKYLKTCSKDCLSKLKSIKSSGNKGGGFRNGSAKNYKYGYYKGIECDSSWELAYVVFALDHNKQVIRNREKFEYTYKNKKHYYYPDFYDADSKTYIEIKNYTTEQVIAKKDQFPKDLNYSIISKDEIAKYIDYCKEIYGDNFTEKLYDKDKVSYLNKNIGTMV